MSLEFKVELLYLSYVLQYSVSTVDNEIDKLTRLYYLFFLNKTEKNYIGLEKLQV